MNEHPIEGLMITAMNSIQDMVDVNTIIGEPIETSNNVVIIPISKVCFGFAIDEYTKKDKEEAIQYRLPFGGGAGAGVNIMPVAFLIVQPSGVKLLPVDHDSCLDKLLDYMPDLVEKANNLINKSMQNKKEEKNKTRHSHVVQKTIPRKPREQKNIVYEYEYEEPVEDAPEEIVFDEADKYDD